MFRLCELLVFFLKNTVQLDDHDGNRCNVQSHDAQLTPSQIPQSIGVAHYLLMGIAPIARVAFNVNIY